MYRTTSSAVGARVSPSASMIFHGVPIGSNPPFFPRSHPPVWCRQCRTVTSFHRLSNCPPAGTSNLRCFITRSSSFSFPASTSRSTPTAVIGFEMLAIRNADVGSTGCLASTLARPNPRA